MPVNPEPTRSPSRALLGLWLTLIAVIFAGAIEIYRSGPVLRADMLAMFPPSQQRLNVSAAVDQLRARILNRVTLAVTFSKDHPPSLDTARQLASAIENQLQQSAWVSPPPLNPVAAPPQWQSHR